MKAYDIIDLHPSTVIVDGSKLKDFMACERYYFFTHVLGWKPDYPNNHLSFGSAWHEAMEHLLLHGYSPESVLAAYDKFLVRYREDFGPETDMMYEPKTPDNAFFVLIEYAKTYVRDNFRVHYTEIGGKVMLTDEHSIYFRMDSICENKEGKMFSLEHKTGSSTYSWDDQWPLSVQGGTYNHVLYCLYPFDMIDGVTFNGCFFKKSKKGWEQVRAGQSLTVAAPFEFYRYPLKKTPDQMNAWHANTVHHMDMLKWRMEMLADCSDNDKTFTAFPMRPEACTRFGRRCAFHDFCTTWSNPLRRCGEPPIGFARSFWNPLAEPPKVEMNVDTQGQMAITKAEDTNDN